MVMNGNVTISKEEYYKLCCAQEKLLFLEGGGVDNWDGYDESLNPDGDQSYSEFCEEEKKRIEKL